MVQGRPRASVYTPDAATVKAYRQQIAIAWRTAFPGMQPLDGPLRVDVVFVLPRPQALIWATKPMPRMPHWHKPDRDNLDKAVLDALEGLAFSNDSQVCSGEITKWIAAGDESPHTEITVQQVSLVP
jgi:crossover junction endodeoxyribonuclease RusA